MMKNLVFISIISIVFVSCSTMKVRHEYDKKTDFTLYKSFSIYPYDQQNSFLYNSSDKEVLEYYLAQELKDRGYKQLAAKGDLIADIYVVIGHKAGSSYRNHYNTGYWSGYSNPYGYRTENLIGGTLIISLYDRKTKTLVWQGTGTGTLTDNPQEAERNIPKRIAQIFYRFPVKKNK